MRPTRSEANPTSRKVTTNLRATFTHTSKHVGEPCEQRRSKSRSPNVDSWNIRSLNAHTQFFVRLSALFDERRQRDHGSVFLTQKRSMLFTPSTNFLHALTHFYSDVRPRVPARQRDPRPALPRPESSTPTTNNNPGNKWQVEEEAGGQDQAVNNCGSSFIRDFLFEVCGGL